MLSDKIILTTYAETDDNERTFTISKKLFNKFIKDQGWKNKKEFLSNYTYDDSEVIYNQAKFLNCVLSEDLIDPYL